LNPPFHTLCKHLKRCLKSNGCASSIISGNDILINPSESPKMPTNTRFGWFFTAVFSLIALYAYVHQMRYFALAATLAATVFLVTTLLKPKILAPLNIIWYQVGILLGKVISPIVLGIIFFVLITPISLIIRICGRDELKIKRSSQQSYWVDRSPPGPPPDSFKNQF